MSTQGGSGTVHSYLIDNVTVNNIIDVFRIDSHSLDGRSGGNRSRSMAVKSLKAPPNIPKGVRAPLEQTLVIAYLLFLCLTVLHLRPGPRMPRFLLFLRHIFVSSEWRS
jgi:hypothetical protein